MGSGSLSADGSACGWVRSEVNGTRGSESAVHGTVAHAIALRATADRHRRFCGLLPTPPLALRDHPAAAAAPPGSPLLSAACPVPHWDNSLPPRCLCCSPSLRLLPLAKVFLLKIQRLACRPPAWQKAVDQARVPPSHTTEQIQYKQYNAAVRPPVMRRYMSSTSWISVSKWEVAS